MNLTGQRLVCGFCFAFLSPRVEASLLVAPGREGERVREIVGSSCRGPKQAEFLGGQQLVDKHLAQMWPVPPHMCLVNEKVE